MHPRTALTLVAVALGASATAAAPSAAMQQGGPIPTRFTNLQVLPRDIPRMELVQTMTAFARDLGLRCASCHVGGDSITLQGMDFASDSSPMKRRARVMLAMVNAINDSYLSELGNDASRITVQCATCHRGVRRPEQLSSILVRLTRSNGAAAAVEEYRRLRQGYYGSAAYDFTANTFIAAGLELNVPATRANALALLRAGLEWYAQSADFHGAIGVVNVASGDTAAAIAAYQRALELQPGHLGYTRLLQRLRGR